METIYALKLIMIPMMPMVCMKDFVKSLLTAIQMTALFTYFLIFLVIF